VFGEVGAECEVCSYSGWGAGGPFFKAVGAGHDRVCFAAWSCCYFGPDRVFSDVAWP
jgi:hypothetical protein